MRSVKTVAVAVTALLALFGLAACGGGMSGMDGMSDGSSDKTSSSAASFNDADVTFAQSMIPHHQQALEMAALADGRTLSPDVQSIVDAVKAAQTPEITTMTGWLKSWGKDAPSDSMSGMDGMEGMGGMNDMPGMMTAAQMSELKDAPDARFEKLWLQMMIEHHRGAIEMANSEIADGKNSDAVALAKSIASSQQEEVTKMQALLAG